jgi:hypothetical protein
MIASPGVSDQAWSPPWITGRAIGSLRNLSQLRRKPSGEVVAFFGSMTDGAEAVRRNRRSSPRNSRCVRLLWSCGRDGELAASAPPNSSVTWPKIEHAEPDPLRVVPRIARRPRLHGHVRARQLGRADAARVRRHHPQDRMGKKATSAANPNPKRNTAPAGQDRLQGVEPRLARVLEGLQIPR